MADVQWAGWVGRNKFNLHFFTLADFTGAKAVAAFENSADDVERGLLVQEKIDEARSRDVYLFDEFRLGDGRDDLRRDIARPVGDGD